MAERGSLRHGGHMNHAEGNANDGAQHQSDGDPFVVHNPVVQQSAGNGENHSQLTGPDAVAGGSWRAHQLQRKNEQRCGDKISDFDDVLGDLHLDHGFFVRLDLNILSMRSVIRQPPTTVLVAATIAIVPSTVENVLLCAPTRRIAPTTAMASNAFVNDISGV